MKYLIRFAVRLIPRVYLLRISHLFSRLIAFYYRGNKVECPVCEHTYRKFLPYGVEYRENVLCPNCLSLERHRLIWLFLKQKTDFFTTPYRMLHVAPEQCFLSRFEKIKSLDYITADIESPLAKVKMDIHSIPFPDAHFDVIFCNHVLEHVSSDHQALKEMYRVLKPGGWAILQSPMDLNREFTYEDPAITSPAAREKHFGQKDHLRMYGRDYGKRIADAGFQVDAIDLCSELKPGLTERYRLNPRELLYCCRK